MQMSSKKIYILNYFICLLLCIISIFVINTSIAFADEPSYIYIDVWYSDGIKAQQGDNFIITYKNLDTQEEKEITLAISLH